MRRIFLLSLLFLSATIPVYAQRYAVFPQFASGAGWSTEIFLANQGLATVSGIVITFYDNNGVPLPVTSNLGSGSVFNLSLNAGATQVIQVTPGSTTITGYVVVRYPFSLAAVTASEVFRFEQGGIVSTEVGVPQQSADNNFSFPVEINSSAGIVTAVAFANPTFDSATAQPQTLVVNLINGDGSLQKTVAVPLLAGQHMAIYLNQPQLFPGLDNFTGSASVSSPLAVGVLALRQDKQAFGGIATDTGPVISPFAVGGSAITEVEPNNSAAQAQLLPGTSLVTGFVGNPSDIDWFKFTGKQGDVATIICNTQGLNSFLDSVVTLMKDDGTTVIATNDQNGLYYENDSFLQTVLPADGTYYITVTDYYGNGSVNYPYRLHLRITPK
jgi:hypothetical protein